MTSDESEDGDDHHSIEEDLDDESTSTQVMANKFVGRKVSIRNLLQKRKYGMIVSIIQRRSFVNICINDRNESFRVKQNIVIKFVLRMQ